MVIEHISRELSQKIRNSNTITIYIYIYSLLFVFNNRDYFVSNSVYHNTNTRRKNDLHLPQEFLAIYQKGVYYSDIKILTVFPRQLRKFQQAKQV
jgi:hypothetical protein